MTIIARLNVTFEEMELEVKRRLEVPFDLRLDRLHQTLQTALGWSDSHLWEITANDVGWGIPDPDWPDGPLDSRKTTLFDVIEDTGAKTLRYLYDFGDGWEHVIKITAIVWRCKNELPSSARRHRPPPAGGCRRPLGLWRLPGSHHRSRS